MSFLIVEAALTTTPAEVVSAAADLDRTVILIAEQDGIRIGFTSTEGVKLPAITLSGSGAREPFRFILPEDHSLWAWSDPSGRTLGIILTKVR